MRLFVALDIPENVRDALREFADRMKRVCPDGRWVRVEGMHLTLKFIGEVPAEKRAGIEKALGGIAAGEPVRIEFRGTGFFPNEKRPRVFWAGVEATPNLAAMAVEVEQRLEPLGIAAEKRAFKPHLTLARFESTRGVDDLRRAVEEAGSVSFGSTTASEMYLYQSELKPGGARYTRLAAFSFAGSNAQGRAAGEKR